MCGGKLGETSGNDDLLIITMGMTNRPTHHLQQAICNLVKLFLSAQLGIPQVLPKVAVVVKHIQICCSQQVHCNMPAEGGTFAMEWRQG